MINKIAFTPAVSTPNAPEKEINFKGLPKEETKEDNSALLYGSLVALGAFGAGMLLRKPKVVEKTVEKTVEKASETVTETAKDVAKKVKPKSKTQRRKSLNVGGRENNRMDKADAKWQRKREKQLLDKQMQREAEEQFTETELQTYMKENGYQAPNAEQRKALDVLHEQNAAERAQKNTIGNLAQIQEPKPVKQPVENPKIKALEGTIGNLRARIAGAKRFGKDTSKYEAQLEKLIEKRDNLLQQAA